MAAMNERDALIEMVVHFAYMNPKKNRFHTGGLSVLEDAFEALGIPDPCPTTHPILNDKRKGDIVV